MAGFGTPAEYFLLSNGQRFYGVPTSMKFGDPMTYYDEFGNVMLSAADYITYQGGSIYVHGTLKNVIEITIEELKEWAKVEHTADDTIFKMLLHAAYASVDTYLNRIWTEKNDPILQVIKLQIFKIVLYWYENRGDTGQIPQDIRGDLSAYRKGPGF